MSKCNVSVYLDPNNLRAAEVYKNVEDVKSITMLLDGRMDGCSYKIGCALYKFYYSCYFILLFVLSYKCREPNRNLRQIRQLLFRKFLLELAELDRRISQAPRQ